MSLIPKSFKVIAIAAIVWNLMGVLAYLGEVMGGAEMIATLPAEQQALYAERPSWVVGAFATAVFAGLLASIALLMKKGIAFPLFVISLIGVIGQQIHMFFLSNTIEVMGGASAAIMPIMVLLIAIYLVYYSNNAKQQGWLS